MNDTVTITISRKWVEIYARLAKERGPGWSPMIGRPISRGFDDEMMEVCTKALEEEK